MYPPATGTTTGGPLGIGNDGVDVTGFSEDVDAEGIDVVTVEVVVRFVADDDGALEDDNKVLPDRAVPAIHVTT